MWSTIKGALILPSAISEFESRYLQKVNRLTVQFFLAHIPVFVAVAWFNDTEPLLALILTSGVAAGPVLARRALSNPRTVGIVYGFTSMLMGGLLVHFGQGPVQIEMHFYFFALLAMLALYGNPMAILTAAATVAAHHLLLWMFLPQSVFNYDAPWWVVAVHAAFVVLESAATVYIARSFFDNVIGLEKVVKERTAQVEERNRAMRLVLDNVDEALLSIDAEGRLSPEYSATVSRWFGEPSEGQSLEAFFSRFDETFAVEFGLMWDQCKEDFLPLELTLDQGPTQIKYQDRCYRVGYRPLLDDGGALKGMLIVIADITAELERKRLEREGTETLAILDRVIVDRAGFLEFFSEAEELLGALSDPSGKSLAVVKRVLHTLKGNCMVFGVRTVAEVCHELENHIVREGTLPEPEELARLELTWKSMRARLGTLLGDTERARIEIDQDQFEELLNAALKKHDHEAIAQLVTNLRLEPTEARLRRVAAQAERIARRLNKPGIDVHIDSSTLRLDPRRWASFWSAFVHVVRNSVDHGLEAGSVREELGKAASGRLELRTMARGEDFVIEVCDDGTGIAWEKVRQRAKAAGLPWETQADLEEALFADGLSTADDVTEYSGRGVGLGAIRAACEAKRGTIRVESNPGQGTRFIFTFPRSEMAPSPCELLAESEVRRVA